MVYDAIVLGAGGVGSAALWHFAQRGASVLGIDRFAPPHDRGSSHGQSRIIRKAYFEHPNYTPLLERAYYLWNELEQASRRKLSYQVGVLQMGPPDGAVIPGVLQCAEKYGILVEELAPGEVERRWPAYRVPENFVGAFEPRAGYLLVEQCVECQLAQARQAGAELRTGVEVQNWDPGPPVRVRTSVGEFVGHRLVVAAGSWAGPLLADLKLHLEVRRKCVFWFALDSRHEAAHDDIPCFLYELPYGVFYGFPRLDGRGIKVAEHSGGEPVTNPLHVDRGISRQDENRVADVLSNYLPYATPRQTDHSVCLYTMSPDEHFVVDQHPEHPHIAFAAGLSGHGFKFVPVLGQVLAELVLDGSTKLPIDFLRLR